MRYPKSVDIAGHSVRLIIRPFKGADSDTFGEYFHDDQLIQINTGLSKRVEVDTIRHEMMEASLLLSGVGYSDVYCQESVVRCLETVFFPAWIAFKKRINYVEE